MVLIIEKDDRKNGIYYLVMKEIFRRYKMKIYKNDKTTGKKFFSGEEKQHKFNVLFQNIKIVINCGKNAFKVISFA